jgi:hypothetical protein
MIAIMANHLGTKWTDWKPFPDPAKGDFIVAPFGPGCYHALTRCGLRLSGHENDEAAN